MRVLDLREILPSSSAMKRLCNPMGVFQGRDLTVEDFSKDFNPSAKVLLTAKDENFR